MHNLLEDLKSGEYLIRIDLLEKYPDLDYQLGRIRSKVFPKYEVIQIENPVLDYQQLIRLQPAGHDPALPVVKKLPHEPISDDITTKPDYHSNVELGKLITKSGRSEPTFAMQVDNWKEYSAWKKEKEEPVPTFQEYIGITTISEESKKEIIAEYEKSPV